jgi:hypothetical protein
MLNRPILTRILIFVPSLGFLLGTPLVNKVEPYILGLPFILFWQALWIVLSGLIMALVRAIDARDRSGPLGEKA